MVSASSCFELISQLLSTFDSFLFFNHVCWKYAHFSFTDSLNPFLWGPVLIISNFLSFMKQKKN